MASHKEIEDQAAAWLAHRDGGDWTDEDQARLADWLESSTAHRVAFLRLERVWDEAQRLKVFAAGMSTHTVPPVGAWRQSPFFDACDREHSGLDAPISSVTKGMLKRLRLRHVALAATVLLFIGLGGYFLNGTLRGNSYSTPTGGHASLPLLDGSNVTLNTASTVRVELTPRERRVDLDHGEAYFVVAKDAGRPFVVHAGNKLVTAVGTQFSVRRDGDTVRVVVTEGIVSLQSMRSASNPRPFDTHNPPADSTFTRATGDILRLSAGAIARASEGTFHVEYVSVSRAQDLVTWREGYLTFHETTLGESVEEFNRYNQHQILIVDPRIADIRVSGTFRPTNYEAFVRLLQQGFSLHAKSDGDSTTLTGAH